VPQLMRTRLVHQPVASAQKSRKSSQKSIKLILKDKTFTLKD